MSPRSVNPTPALLGDPSRQYGDTHSAIPPSAPVPPQRSPVANVPMFMPVGTNSGASGLSVSFTNGRQCPVPYPFSMPLYTQPPPPPPPGFGIPITNPIQSPGVNCLPSQVPLVACHLCSECGRQRSKSYHSRHPIAPGTVVLSGPCRRCIRKSKHRETKVDQPTSCVVEKKTSRTSRCHSPSPQRVQTRVTLDRSTARSPSPQQPKPCTSRLRSTPLDRLEEDDVRYRYISIRRISDPQVRHTSQYRECRPSDRKDQRMKYRHKRTECVSPLPGPKAKDWPDTDSELIAKKRRDVSREGFGDQVSRYPHIYTQNIYRDCLLLPVCLQGTSGCESPSLFECMADDSSEGESTTRASRHHWMRSIWIFPPQDI